MRRISYLLMATLIFTSLSCTRMQISDGGKTETNGRDSTQKVNGNRLKGTNTEIMNAFKDLLARYEFEQFSMATLKIITKPKKLDESSPYFAKYKRGMDIYEQYDITMTREAYDMVVDIKYAIQVQEMNMKTNVIGYKEIARVKEAENDLLKKIKRLLYGA